MNCFWIFLIFIPQICSAWDSDQLEIFDVVEEVQENFYNLLNVTNDASHDQIKSAFRKLSLKLHPDKNVDRDTSAEFRNLVSVYEVLKTPSKRKYYDDILKNGLPNWRNAVYYYRYVRKMGMTEVCIILFTIITIGQYLVNWAAYLEKKYELEQTRKKKRKDRDKIEEYVLEKPSFYDTLPIQIPRLAWFIITSLPYAIVSMKSMLTYHIQETIKKPPLEEPQVEIPKIKTVRKRNKGFLIPEGPNFETTYNPKTSQDSSTNAPLISGGLWTDDDLAELIKLIKKYPGGSSNRWEVIADSLGRSVPEVTYMAAKVKENGYRLPNEEEKVLEPLAAKIKTKKDALLPEETKEVHSWNQDQQKALEEALLKFPKGCNDRWDRIAEHVPNKSKEECMLRFRFLAENLKRQKGKQLEEDLEKAKNNTNE
ncbi:dnaJ homolog subfamily C member 1 [Harmonia axyridis]|uniref:dnaJ homolog subfamily C member 1 n=1 Tax=Harmonia axyridis TaxID=115357 RepID=UPI001E278810|nr:dnaJ homolog subfamily C member 1 [Harmonia axyridis]